MTPEEMRAIREAAGFSQAALARLFGVSRPRTIRRYETGYLEPSGPVTLLYERLRDGTLGPAHGPGARDEGETG